MLVIQSMVSALTSRDPGASPSELLAALNDYVSNVRRTPTWNRLVVKYFGEAAPEVLKAAREGAPRDGTP